jgi:chromosome partitioning protein
MKCIAVINQKGGCGKTTTTINLGASLAFLKKKTLIVDLDPQAHATLGLGYLRDDDAPSVSDLLLEDPPGATAVATAISELSDTLHLLPSNVSLSMSEPILLQRENREIALATILSPLADQYEFILIDCPPSIGILTFNAIFACTEAIIPIESGLFALHGLARLLETVAIVSRQREREIPAYALMTMFDRRTRIAHESLNEIRSHMQEYALKTIINYNVKLKEASGYGKSIIDYDLLSSGFNDYINLAHEVIALYKTRKVRDVKELSLHFTSPDGINAEQSDNHAPAVVPVVTKDGVLFRYYSPQASRVHVVADFNEWTIGESPMENIDGKGIWQKFVPLAKGKYEYKFYVDDTWVNDPQNPHKATNQYGENSIIKID